MLLLPAAVGKRGGGANPLPPDERDGTRASGNPAAVVHDYADGTRVPRPGCALGAIILEHGGSTLQRESKQGTGGAAFPSARDVPEEKKS